MASIDTLVADLEKLLVNGVDGLPEDLLNEFGKSLSSTVATKLQPQEVRGTLRMSNIGKPCQRQLWYEVNTPNDKEALSAAVKTKFLFGDILEDLLLFLCGVSGHTVSGRQDTQEISGIKGHRDCIIDGVLVDVKSASSYSFRKFESHLSPSEDSFGYITQLQSYLHAGQRDPLVTDKRRGAFLVIDKTLGHICLDFHEYKPYDWESEYERRKEMVSLRTPPPRGFREVPEGKSGNRKLGVECSYCPFKHSCYPNLRVFNYYNGPTFLTHVVREPNVPEVGIKTELME